MYVDELAVGLKDSKAFFGLENISLNYKSQDQFLSPWDLILNEKSMVPCAWRHSNMIKVWRFSMNRCIELNSN